jgi:hypothetical protein
MYDRRKIIALADNADVPTRRRIPARLPDENGFDGDIACALVKGIRMR